MKAIRLRPVLKKNFMPLDFACLPTQNIPSKDVNFSLVDIAYFCSELVKES